MHATTLLLIHAIYWPTVFPFPEEKKLSLSTSQAFSFAVLLWLLDFKRVTRDGGRGFHVILTYEEGVATLR
jgi:hypothetical protein